MIKFSKVAVATIAALTLAACGDDSSSSNSDSEVVTLTPVEYELTFTNLTNGQPISPPAVILHDSGELWSIGEPASDALELLAESGDSTEIQTLSLVTNLAVSSGPALPGETISVTVSHTDTVDYLSFASMLGNTNDAFTGINKLDLSDLVINESVTYRTSAYDAGTEANTESAETVPGPAANGEAYNAERDDINDFVSMHAGIITNADGLSTSVLTYQQKFDNPVLSVTITRLK
ncbi:spondin domain-containing protein [Psychromonas sp.]|nr:spondin domain-containing protein [Psychromonas sp.]